MIVLEVTGCSDSREPELVDGCSAKLTDLASTVCFGRLNLDNISS